MYLSQVLPPTSEAASAGDEDDDDDEGGNASGGASTVKSLAASCSPGGAFGYAHCRLSAGLYTDFND